MDQPLPVELVHEASAAMDLSGGTGRVIISPVRSLILVGAALYMYLCESCQDSSTLTDADGIIMFITHAPVEFASGTAENTAKVPKLLQKLGHV